jgi:hypothetical protein
VELKMKTHPHRSTVFLTIFAAAAVVHAADDKASVERIIMGYYHEMEQGYAAKDAAQVYHRYDPSYLFSALHNSSTSDLASNRKALDESFGKVKSILMKISPEATDMVGDKFYIRYKQENQILFPLKSAPANIWYEAEDTWQRKNGAWVLLSTQVVNDSVAQAKGRLEEQKKRMEIEDEQRRSRRCLNGLGYGCGEYH